MTRMNHKPLTALSWVEISRSAFRHNIRLFRELIGPRRKLMAVVKANAYGHGIGEVSRLAL
jgi:alanine racemase